MSTKAIRDVLNDNGNSYFMTSVLDRALTANKCDLNKTLQELELIVALLKDLKNTLEK